MTVMTVIGSVFGPDGPLVVVTVPDFAGGTTVTFIHVRSDGCDGCDGCVRSGLQNMQTGATGSSGALPNRCPWPADSARRRLSASVKARGFFGQSRPLVDFSAGDLGQLREQLTGSPCQAPAEINSISGRRDWRDLKSQRMALVAIGGNARMKVSGFQPSADSAAVTHRVGSAMRGRCFRTTASSFATGGGNGIEQGAQDLRPDSVDSRARTPSRSAGRSR